MSERIDPDYRWAIEQLDLLGYHDAAHALRHLVDERDALGREVDRLNRLVGELAEGIADHMGLHDEDES